MKLNDFVVIKIVTHLNPPLFNCETPSTSLVKMDNRQTDEVVRFLRGWRYYEEYREICEEISDILPNIKFRRILQRKQEHHGARPTNIED